ncbi:MAG: lamin tail domain-containing protein [Brumimicrobium sp.]|nr:lamin tail domain-containing protein [Brumimicrobium sp.]
MKQFLFIILTFSLSFSLWSQMNDSFDDGDFTNNPTWTGNTTDFIVNTNHELQLNASGAGQSYLVTPHNLTQLEDMEWRFKIKYAFPPSNQNKGETYLTAVNADLSTNPDGIFIHIGETGTNDPIQLFERNGGVETLILSSTSGIVANAFDINVKIIYRNNGDWELYTDLTGGTNFLLDVSANYSASILGLYLGMDLTYTLGNITKFYYDDFYAGPIIVDNIPPNILSAAATSNNTLEVIFNEPIDQVTGELITNYSVSSGIGNPTSVIQDGGNPQKFTLTFASNFTIGTPYTLTAENVEDLAGNAMTSQNTTFTYFEAQTPVFGDIVINEFMPKPTPTIGLPDVQFVELYNRSNKYFNLNGWKLSDNNSSGTIQNVWLSPGEYLILVPTSGLTSYPTATNVTNWAQLNIAGDEIHLTSDLGVVVDELTYTNAWYQDEIKKNGGWSIERINPETPCSTADNWRASDDPNGGTPGIQNSIYNNTPDTQKPTVINREVTLPSTLTFTFSERVDSLSLVNAVFASNPSLTINTRVISGAYPTSFSILFNEVINDGILYEYTLENFYDCSGNANSDTGTFVLPQIPDFGDVIINEFMVKPSPSFGLPEIQYVELYNRSNKYLNVNTWLLKDNSSYGKIQNGWLYPGEYLVLVPTGGKADYPNATEVTSWAQLNITGDEIHLMRSDSLILDELTYTDAWYKNDLKKSGGWSIERINPELPCSTSDNWAASYYYMGGTPGAQNSIYNNTPDTQMPTVLNSFAESPNLLTITFSEGMDRNSLENITFSSTSQLSIDSIILNGNYPTEITIIFNETLVDGVVYNFSIQNFSDCSGNSGDYTGTFVIPQKPEKGDILINEILFNPLTGGSDFIEVYNTSTKYINLKDFMLANYKDGGIANVKQVGYNYLLNPHDYAVFTKDSNFQIMNYPVAVPGKFVKIDLPSYNNDSSTVYLIYNDTVLDKVSYQEKWHFALLQDKKGVSLERLSAELPSNSSANWHSASETIGFATPGRKNSQFTQTTGNGVLTLSSQTFSPDEDGFEDVLLITYEVDSPDLTGNMVIYDDKGRKVRVLMENHLLGAEGTIQWDGLKDDGRKAVIGPYIILFEIFDLNAAKLQTIRKVVTVAGRL